MTKDEIRQAWLDDTTEQEWKESEKRAEKYIKMILELDKKKLNERIKK